ncbi:glycosyltransferase family 4 protein [Ferrovibrio sp.]|uniref:MraY family glycosyltransferase n=1 Tax=Ferrovibrio sp. TaxID=1917215 RepID=UPI001B546D85|nr:glycosyltransferase family 4 protein [Ferrovibrio sp.]MBP7064062.1 glycosyltransferase family 4 protein [Ferrovibrio sp.]
MIGSEAWLLALGFAALAGIGTALLLLPLIVWLKTRAVLDLPNARSSHTQPTPRGGGIAVVAMVLALGLPWVTLTEQFANGLLLVGFLVLALLFWFDDRLGGLPISLRMGAQALAVALVLGQLPPEARIASGMLADWLPLWLERLLCFLAWLWFVNLFNFMDGINGITGVEMVGIGLGLAACAALAGFGAAPAGLALIVAGAGLGFLRYNWGQAQVFMGDVGSVPVGFLLGGLLLQAALSGLWAAALILPLYYWFDATITLLRRALKRERIWQAHRQHFYQQGARKAGAHAPVAGKIALLNAALIGLALLAQSGPRPWSEIAALLLGLVLVLALCRHFKE